MNSTPWSSKLQVYCSEDLGAFYLDVLKDRLYTTAPKSRWPAAAHKRRCHQITQAMLRWMAPFLSFTAEEVWALEGRKPFGLYLHRDLTQSSMGQADDALARQMDPPARDP